MNIYTRTGDDGSTGLFSGERVTKSHPRVIAYGTVDELNSQIGAARAAGPASEVDALLLSVQQQLFVLGSDLATITAPAGMKRISESDITWLETGIDQMTAQLPPLRNFILPGGTLAAAHIHLARTVCRRTEREVLELIASHSVSSIVQTYLNRLSDFLFTLARLENQFNGFGEQKWTTES